MTSTKIALTGIGLAFYLAVGQTAWAAKGVQKGNGANNPATNTPGVNAAGAVGANTQHVVTGVVLSVDHHPKNGGVTFHVRTAHHHKKLGTGNGANRANAGTGANHQHHGHEFHVTAATRFEHHNGSPATVAALRRGERVRVHAVGHQAMNVHILSHHNPHANFARYRPHRYRAMAMRPRMIHPAVHRHPRRR